MTIGAVVDSVDVDFVGTTDLSERERRLIAAAPATMSTPRSWRPRLRRGPE
ncbi:MAG: hypothetical protein ACT4PW_09400 [Acidimicrobiia bacterium]